jgi:ABC-type branched-subunit amino acid transport system permease subunit
MSVLTSLEFWSFVGVIAGIYTIFALGLQVQFGITGLMNFGHVAFMAISAYTMAILVVKSDWPLWAASLAALAAGIGFGLLIGLPSVRLRADYFAITTIAFAEIVRYVALNWTALTGGSQGSIALAGPTAAASYNGSWVEFQTTVGDWLGPILGDDPNENVVMMVIVWVVALVLLVLTWFVIRSPWGRVLKAIREDEQATAALGKNVFWYKLQSLALGAALGAIAGLFYAYQFSFFSPGDFEPLITFFAWTIVILGGTARVWAVPVGAIVFGLIFAGTRFFDFAPFTYFDAPERAYLRLVIIGLILIALMAFRPQGLLGRKEDLVFE